MTYISQWDCLSVAYDHRHLGVRLNETMQAWPLPSTAGTTSASFEDLQYAGLPQAFFIWRIWQKLFQISTASIFSGILILSEQGHAQCDKSRASIADVLHWIQTPPLIKQCGYGQKDSKPSKWMKFTCNIRATSQKNNFVLASTPQQPDFP